MIPEPVVARAALLFPCAESTGVRRQLAWHDVTAELLRLGDGIATAEEVLPEVVRDVNAGLLVIGGFGHSRLRETVFGGVTRRLLERAEIPLFVVH